MQYPDYQHLRFVLADDSVHMRRIIRSMLRICGVRDILEAEDGVSCIELVENHHPDILITDIKMPILDGIEMIQLIRNSELVELKTMPVIILTGYAEREFVVNAKKAGADAFLRKPVSASDLMSRIRFVLDKPGFLSASSKTEGPQFWDVQEI
jgi:CheY-like chemotaxis protein